MFGFGRKGHPRKHDIASAIDHKGDIYESLIGAVNALTTANVAVDTKTLNDAISAAIVGMDWQSNIIRFEAMVTNEPVVPSDGDRYISTESGTIPSTTQAVLIDDVCQWDTGTSLWIITSPEDGWAVIEDGVDPNIAWWYSGTQWRKLGTIVSHANLQELNWSVAAHVIDTDFDLNTHKIINMVNGVASSDGMAFGQRYTNAEAEATVKANVEVGDLKLPTKVLDMNSQKIEKCRHIGVRYVSDSLGDDTNGDGDEDNPFKTAQAAYAAGLAAFDPVIILIIDSNSSTPYVLNIPDGSPPTSICALEAMLMSWSTFSSITIGANNVVTIDNLSIAKLKEGTSSNFTSLYVEECFIGTLLDNAETGAPANWDITFADSLMNTVAITNAIAMTSRARGSLLDHQTDKSYNLTELSMNSKKITDVSDPAAAQDAATKNYHDTTPAPPTIHGISDNTKHSGALVSDNITLGDANGLVKDSGVAISSIVGGLNYQGTWDASTNTPTLADGTGTKGHYYRVSVGGTQDLGSGNIAFVAEDFVAHNGTIWQKIDHTDQVTSIFTRQGAVVALASDYDASQIDNDSGVTGAFVDDALDQLDTDKVNKSLFDANTILAADTDDTPAALTVPVQTLVGRITAGNIDALTVSEVWTLLGGKPTFPHQFSEGANLAGSQTGYLNSFGSYSAQASAQSSFGKCRAIKLIVNITTNNLNSSTTFQLEVNGTPVGTAISYGAGVTGRQSQVESIAIAADDMLDVKIVIGGTPGQSIGIREISLICEGVQ